MDEAVTTIPPEAFIDRLPAETLARAFVLCLPEADTYISPSTEKAPLVFLQVCKSWKDLAEGTALLWASVQLELRRSPSLVTEEVVDKWLSRSSACPLSLKLCDALATIPDRDAIETDGSFVIKLVDRILAESHRWKCIHFQLSASRTVVRRLVALEKYHFPLLQSFTVSIEDSAHDFDLEDPSYHLNMDGTSLNSMSCLSVDPPVRVAPRTLSLTITSLSLTVPDLAFLSCVPPLCPNLAALTMSFGLISNAASFTTPDMNEVTFMHLHAITFSTSEDLDPVLTRVFELLRLPALRSFALLRTVVISRLAADSLAGLFRRCGSTVQNVYLNPIFWEASSLFHCLQALPKVRRLDVCTAQNFEFRYLEWCDKHRLCRRLEQLRVRYFDDFTKTVSVFKSIILSRWWTPAANPEVIQLQKLTIDDYDAYTELANDDQVSECIREGFVLEGPSCANTRTV